MQLFLAIIGASILPLVMLGMYSMDGGFDKPHHIDDEWREVK